MASQYSGMGYGFDWTRYYKSAIWGRIKATRDAYLADPATPLPDWMVCYTRSIAAHSERLHYAVYDRLKPGKVLTYGYDGNVDDSLHAIIRVELDKHNFPRSGRDWFKTPTGQLMGLPLSTALELIRELNKRNCQAVTG